MLNGKIDLRSDTITQPDAAMREAMANAVVGDDVLGDDPTVQELERHTAELLGKAAAAFVPSGTMANQLAIRSLTRPGDAIVLDANAHIHCYEAGAPAALSGVQVSLLDGERGQFTAAQLEAALPPKDDHFAPPSLVCIENTHNRGGGSVWPLEQIESVTSTARGHGLALHLDGARLWNDAMAREQAGTHILTDVPPDSVARLRIFVAAPAGGPPRQDFSFTVRATDREGGGDREPARFERP